MELAWTGLHALALETAGARCTTGSDVGVWLGLPGDFDLSMLCHTVTEI